MEQSELYISRISKHVNYVSVYLLFLECYWTRKRSTILASNLKMSIQAFVEAQKPIQNGI